MPQASTIIERFSALLSPVHRAFACFLAAAGSFGDAAIDGHVGQIETDGAVVGFECHILQSIHQTGLDPLVASATQRSSRARPIGDSAVGAAKDQHFNQFLEDHAVGYAGPVAA